MIRVGETAGVLDQVMASLSDFAQRDLHQTADNNLRVEPTIVTVPSFMIP